MSGPSLAAWIPILEGKNQETVGGGDRQEKHVRERELHDACKGGHLAAIRQLLDLGVSVEAQSSLSEDPWTPLHTAVQYNRREVVEMLLDVGANIEARGGGKTALLRAINCRNFEIAVLLLDRKASVHAVDHKSGKTALHYAAKHYSMSDLIDRLLDSGLRVDSRDRSRNTALIDGAAENDSDQSLRLLLLRGASVNSRNANGETALHAACSITVNEIVNAKVLIEHGADPSIKNHVGLTPYDVFKLPRTWQHYAPLGPRRTSRRGLYYESDAERRAIDAEYAFLRESNVPDPYLGYETRQIDAEEQDQDRLEEEEHADITTMKLARERYLCDRVVELERRNAVLRRPYSAISSMLFSERFADVVFHCADGECIHAHRCVVGACSEALGALLEGQWAETVGEYEHMAVVKMGQCGLAVRAFLRFLYTGEVDGDAVATNLDELLELAAMYDQGELTAECEECACRALTIETAPDMLLTADLIGMEELKQSALELIFDDVDNGDGVVTDLPAFLALKGSPTWELLQGDELIRLVGKRRKKWVDDFPALGR